MKEFIQKNALYGAFTVSLMAILGSLFFSQIMLLPPCILCWYQRICMYPLVAILGFAIYKKNREMVAPAILLAVVGWIISLYHNLLYFGILPEAVAPCVAGVSCTTEFPGWLTYFPIPAQAFVGFTAVLVGLIIYWKTSKKGDQV